MTRPLSLLVLCGCLMAAGCGIVQADEVEESTDSYWLHLSTDTPKYGIHYKSNWGARRPHDQKTAGNYNNDAIIEYYEPSEGRPIAFQWVGDILWIMWEKKPEPDDDLTQYPHYEIIPHPVDEYISTVQIMDMRDWKAYRKWIEAGAPRSWEAHYDRQFEKIIFDPQEKKP